MQEIEQRLISLDVFRGITIAGMIVVNNTAGRTYSQLHHVAWHGWTITDLIFPFFLFAVGVAIVYSFSKGIEKGATHKDLYLKILSRTIILFILGLIWNLFYHEFSHFRIPGVLQRIAICYAIVSLLVLHFNKKSQMYISVGLLFIYWMVIKLVPVPGYGAGVIEPIGNLPGYIDKILLKGYTWPSAVAEGFDPQGILSTIPSISNVLFGVLAGHWLMSNKNQFEKAGGLFFVGYSSVLFAFILSIWIPFNKKLGTPSFTIFIAGMALITLTMFYWIIDIKGYKKWTTVFLVFGKNAITAFFLSTILDGIMRVWLKLPQPNGTTIPLKTFIYQTVFAPLGSQEFSSMLYGITYMVVWIGLMFILYKKKIFIKV